MIGYLLVRIVEISFNIFHALFFYINKILLNIIHNSTIMVKTIKKKIIKTIEMIKLKHKIIKKKKEEDQRSLFV